jgi:hypothetical protein
VGIVGERGHATQLDRKFQRTQRTRGAFQVHQALLGLLLRRTRVGTIYIQELLSEDGDIRTLQAQQIGGFGALRGRRAGKQYASHECRPWNASKPDHVGSPLRSWGNDTARVRLVAGRTAKSSGFRVPEGCFS